MPTSATQRFGARIADLVNRLYGKVEPTGYPNTGEAGLTRASVLGESILRRGCSGGPFLA